MNEWSKLAKNSAVNPPLKTKFISCHPGWVDTPGVSKAYGRIGAWLLAPLRNIYQGSEGIAWLASTPSRSSTSTSSGSTSTSSEETTDPNKEDILVSGGFYLDRQLQSQHLPPFWFGKLFPSYHHFTKNSEDEVKELLDSLAKATEKVSSSNAWMHTSSDKSCSSSSS